MESVEQKIAGNMGHLRSLKQLISITWQFSLVIDNIILLVKWKYQALL